jgi:aspartate aminotransferase-like enzyme
MAEKLFIPGPIEVNKEILNEMARPMIGHRGNSFTELFHSLPPTLQELFGTKNDVLISTSSGSGFWEASIRSCVNKKVLHAVNGAFSKKWYEVSLSCDKDAKKINFLEGKPVDAKMIEHELEKNEYEAFCMVHNETSTGVTSSLLEIANVMKKYPKVLWIVDAVSSFAGMPLNIDEFGIDFCLASSQKALGLPPGIAIAAVSKRCYEKALNVKGRGYYFDILELKSMYDKDQTPYTPSISHLYALKLQLEKIKAETPLGRFNRHKELAQITRNWVSKNGLKMFSEDGYQSDTVSCVINNKKIDLALLKKKLSVRGYVFDSGYGKLNEKLIANGKDSTFRIAHMGDLKIDELQKFLEIIVEEW